MASRYDGTEISDARKLKALEEENRRLRKLPSEPCWDASTLNEVFGNDTQLAETRCDMGDQCEGLLAATGVQAGWHAAENLSLCSMRPDDSALQI